MAVATTAFRVRRLRRAPAEVGAQRARRVRTDDDGAGVVIVVNPGGGSADDGVAALLRRELPAATVTELATGDDLPDALERAASTPGVRVLGAAGGDGTINAAAAVAVRHDLPLAVIPAGTLNHLARDLGLHTVEDAIDAIVDGRAAEIDLPSIGERSFLNTASFGSYAELVDVREELEDRIGKWPAVLVAGWRVLRHGTPLEVVLDGEQLQVWMVFIGNGRYLPEGFAPSHRERLDDGLLDVRLIDAGHPRARTRLILGLLTGRLGRSPVYREWTTARLTVAYEAGPLRLACDGETFDGDAEVVVEKAGRRLAVLTPMPTDA